MMSLRALKKRENQINTPPVIRPTLYRKSTNSSKKFTSSTLSKVATTSKYLNSSSAAATAENLQKFSGRLTRSNPELRHPFDTLERFETLHDNLVRTKSENDINTLLVKNTETCGVTGGSSGGGAGAGGAVKRGLLAAKSEVCLQSISSHNYTAYEISGATDGISVNCGSAGATETHLNGIILNNNKEKMLSGARSHRDLTQSAYMADVTVSSTPRRMSDWSCHSSAAGYTSRSVSAMSGVSSSGLTLASGMSSSNVTPHYTPSPVDPNTILRVPIIGYEVMEERARFTVYKLRVENPHTNDCWLVMRRYTDFVRLNTKLKQLYPKIILQLPRKKIFGDNFNSVFLDNRVQGLQMFVNSIMSKEDLRKCKLVRDFFCLDEPPTYSESMEECRAIFEAQEETISHLKLQISNKNDLILGLQQKLRDEINEKERLKEILSNPTTTELCKQCKLNAQKETSTASPPNHIK